MKALLIRHATSTHQAPDAPLAPDGYEQAEKLIPTLTNLEAGPLYASPYRRAQETIAPFAAASGQGVTILDGLRERRLADGDLPDWQDHVSRSFDDPGYSAPGGESHRDLVTRAATALTDVERRGGMLPALVTHGGLSAALFNACYPEFGAAEWRALRNPELYAIILGGGRILDFECIDLEMHQ